MKLLLVVLFFFVHYNFSLKAPRQELGTVEYFNPSYLSEAKCFTSRTSRRDVYKTNVTLTTLVPAGNNFTIRFQHNMKNSPMDFEFNRKFCEILSVKWMNEMINRYSDVEMKCPFPPRTYNFFNIEIDPKKLPVPLPKGMNILRIVVEKTDTRELAWKSSLVVHVS